jgi:hypothetical protein
MHVAEGIPDELYLATTPPERAALLSKIRELRHRDHVLTSGLVASVIYNRLPGPARQAKQPEDWYTTRKAALPVTPEDRARLAHLMGPTDRHGRPVTVGVA